MKTRLFDRMRSVIFIPPHSKSSFKKHIIATGTGTTEHIVYADHAVGQADAYRRNTFRSMGQLGVVTPSPYPYEASDELRDRDIRFVDAEQ